MAGAKVPAPLDPMVNGDDWTNILARYNRTVKGSEGVSLTNWVAGNTDRPEIAAGSVIEIDGAPFEYATDETIVDEAGLTDGWCYIKHVVSGSSVTPTLVNTFGTWDTAKQGFYDGSGNRFSLFAMYRSGAIIKIFTRKNNMVNNNGLPVIAQYETSAPYVIGRMDLDSEQNAGEIIKHRRYNITITNGSTSYTLTHGISNAATNNRVVDLRMKNMEDVGPTRYGGEGYATYRFMSYYSFRDSDVIIYLGATQNANRNYCVDITYI